MNHYDSTGRPIRVGNKVKFRGEHYTIKSFLENEAARATQIEFEEPQHTKEVADEWSVDLL